MAKEKKERKARAPGKTQKNLVSVAFRMTLEEWQALTATARELGIGDAEAFRAGAKLFVQKSNIYSYPEVPAEVYKRGRPSTKAA